MNKCLLTTLAAITASGVAALALPAQAANISKTFYMDPAISCQLSIPTIDTSMRPRATGFRNEGGTGTFVICGMPYHYSVGATSTAYKIGLASFDGVAHTFNCTAVSRSYTGGSALYSTQSVTTSSGGGITVKTWTDPDVQTGNFDASITCVLPDGAAIVSVQMQFDDDIGS